MAPGCHCPGTEKVVSSTQLLLRGASCTHYTITRTNKDSTSVTPSLTLTWVRADQQSQVHTHTYTHVRIHTHSQNTSCAPTGASPSTAVHLPRRDLVAGQ